MLVILCQRKWIDKRDRQGDWEIGLHLFFPISEEMWIRINNITKEELLTVRRSSKETKTYQSKYFVFLQDLDQKPKDCLLLFYMPSSSSHLLW